MHILQHVGIRRYAGNTLWLLIENILRIIAGILVGIWVTRYLGPTRYGELSYALAFVSIFGPIAKIGLDGIIVRNLINYPSLQSLYLGTAFWLKLVVALIIFAVVCVLSPELYVRIIAATLIFQSIEVVDFYFQSQVKSKLVSIAKIIQLVVSSLLKLYFMKINAGLDYFVYLYLLEQIFLGLLLYTISSIQKIPSFIPQFDRNIALKLVLESWPIIVISVANMLQSRADQLMISTKINSLELGYYAAAIGFIELFSFLPIVINSSVAPAIINAKKRSIALYHRRLEAYYSVMFLLFVTIGFPILLLGKPLIVFLYGTDFTRAGYIFSLLFLRIFFANMGVARSQFILNEGLFRFNLIATVIGAAFSLVLNFLVLPVYGIVGAIIVSYISFSLSTFIVDLFHKSTRFNLLLMFFGVVKSYNVARLKNIL